MAAIVHREPGSTETIDRGPDGRAATPATPRSALAALRATVWHPAAAVLAVASVAAALGFLWLGRSQWFFQDEWHFLAERDAGSMSSLIEPHNEHLSTVPILYYRALWNVVGLRSYLPYQLMSLASHLLVVWLLWLIMLRSRVSPWPATAAAGLLLFYGAGAENVVWAFQVGFLGGVVGGLACFLVADAHPTRARTVGAVAAGAYGLLCAGTGLVVVAVALAAVACRRGLRRALVVGVPLAVPYAIWWVRYQPPTSDERSSTVGDLARFVGTGMTKVFSTFAAGPVAGAGIALAVAVGVVLLVAGGRAEGPGALRSSVAAPIVFAAGSVGFYLVTARSRVADFGPDFALRSRYAYVALALLIPIVGVGIEGLRRRSPAVAWVTCGVIVLVLPASLRATSIREHPDVRPATVAAIGHAPWLASIAPDVHPFPDRTGARAITVGWLEDGADTGRLPHDLVGGTGPANALALLAVSTSPEEPPADAACGRIAGPRRITVGPDLPEVWTFGPLSGRVVDEPSGAMSEPLVLHSLRFRRIDSIAATSLELEPDPATSATVCTATRP